MTKFIPIIQLGESLFMEGERTSHTQVASPTYSKVTDFTTFREGRESYDAYFLKEAKGKSKYILDFRHIEVLNKAIDACKYLDDIQDAGGAHQHSEELHTIMCPYHSHSKTPDSVVAKLQEFTHENTHGTFGNALCKYYDFILQEVDSIDPDHEELVVYLEHLGPAIKHMKAAMYLRASPWVIRSHHYSPEVLVWELSIRDIGDMASEPEWLPKRYRRNSNRDVFEEEMLRSGGQPSSWSKQ